MSDDLISRKAVIDYLKEQNNNLLMEKQKNGVVSTEACRGMESALIAFRSFILAQPMAFDKEKVIEELKGQIELVSYNPMTAGRYIKKDRAIKIVEKGGIE